jgi:hypothetical protein
MVLTKKNSRFVSLYYRDEKGVMRRLPGLQLHVFKGKPIEVYTLDVPIKTLEVRE